MAYPEHVSQVAPPATMSELSSPVEPPSATSTAFDTGSRAGAAGFIGKMSEVSWIQRAREHLTRGFSGAVDILDGGFDDLAFSSEEMDYHMDDVELLAVDEDHVNELEWPDVETSKVLASAYFDNLHGAFPFLFRAHFFSTIAAFPRFKAQLSWPERRWLAVANVVFAVGSRWMFLSGSQMSFINNGPHDHLLYYARARALGLDHRILMDHPLVEQVQALGVLGLYLVLTNHIATYGV